MMMTKLDIDISKDIGKQMKEIREKCDISLSEVARGIGVTAATLSYYEHNKRVQNVNILRKFIIFCQTRIK